MRLALSLSAVLTWLAGPVLASDPGAPSLSPTETQGSSEIAALQNRDEVDRLLASAGAQALFENISNDRVGVARHRASGMVCLFAPSDRMNLIVVYPQVAGGPAPGDDVSCRTGLGDGIFATVYATRYPQQPTDQQLLDHAMTDVGGVWTDVQPLESGYSFQHSPNYPNPLTAAFTGNLQGHHLRSFTLVQNIGEWSFKGRASGRIDDDNVSMAGSGYFAIALPGNWEARQTP